MDEKDVEGTNILLMVCKSAPKIPFNNFLFALPILLSTLHPSLIPPSFSHSSIFLSFFHPSFNPPSLFQPSIPFSTLHLSFIPPSLSHSSISLSFFQSISHSFMNQFKLPFLHSFIRSIAIDSKFNQLISQQKSNRTHVNEQPWKV